MALFAETTKTQTLASSEASATGLLAALKNSSLFGETQKGLFESLLTETEKTFVPQQLAETASAPMPKAPPLKEADAPQMLKGEQHKDSAPRREVAQDDAVPEEGPVKETETLALEETTPEDAPIEEPTTAQAQSEDTEEAPVRSQAGLMAQVAAFIRKGAEKNGKTEETAQPSPTATDETKIAVATTDETEKSAETALTETEAPVLVKTEETAETAAAEGEETAATEPEETLPEEMTFWAAALFAPVVVQEQRQTAFHRGEDSTGESEACEGAASQAKGPMLLPQEETDGLVEKAALSPKTADMAVTEEEGAASTLSFSLEKVTREKTEGWENPTSQAKATADTAAQNLIVGQAVNMTATPKASGAETQTATVGQSSGTSSTPTQALGGLGRGAGTYDFASQLSTTAATKTQTQATAQAVQQVVAQVHKMVKAGQSEMTIQLRPEELGKIEIKLSFSSENKVHGAIVADKASTLELLQKDANVLRQALQDTGLQADMNSLEFSLRDGASQSGFAQKEGKGKNFGFVMPLDGDGTDIVAQEEIETYYLTPQRVNLRV